MDNTDNIVIIEFVEYLLRYYDYYIFDFDNTITQLHLAGKLESQNWQSKFEDNKIHGYISNPKFFKLLLTNISKYPEKKFFVFTHGNNEVGVRYILEKGLNLTPELANNIIIIAGRNIQSKNPLYMIPNSLNSINPDFFEYKALKEDMFSFVESRLNINFTTENTIFFDDTTVNIDHNCITKQKCTGVYVNLQLVAQGVNQIRVSDGFNPTTLRQYLNILRPASVNKQMRPIQSLFGLDILDQSGGNKFNEDIIESRVRRLFNL